MNSNHYATGVAPRSEQDIKRDRLWSALDNIEAEIEDFEEQALLLPELATRSPEKTQAHLRLLNKQRSLLLDRIAELPPPQVDEPAPDDAVENAALDEAEALIGKNEFEAARRLLSLEMLRHRGSPAKKARLRRLWAAMTPAADTRSQGLLAIRKAPSARSQLRAALGRDAVISITEAAERLPWDDSDTQWMVDVGITFPRGRSRYVVWGDVLDALPARDRPKKSPRRRTRKKGAVALDQEVKASDLPRF